MELERQGNDSKAFPTPYSNLNVYYPQTYRDHRYHPYGRHDYDYRGRRSRYGYDSTSQLKVQDLQDRALDYHGDLGWTLEYATAWCYRHLVGNQAEVADAIDKVRELRCVVDKTPYKIFDFLDQALFGRKLRSMVQLRWKSQASFVCGTTSAPGVVPGVPRICIELNQLPFEEETGSIDDLLDALIHHMIHAFFLVCCGAQPKGAKQDGRLADGVHFGVILYTVLDISRQCQAGALALMFYSATRREQSDSRDPYANAYGHGVRRSGRRNDRQAFISIDPRGSAVGAPPADGQTHCAHDNRKIRTAEIRNWQVEHYSRAIDLRMEDKGDMIYDLGIDNKLVDTLRLKGPPSTTYVEMIWKEKRIMIPRDKALSFPTLKKPIEKDGKMELKLPECNTFVLRIVYDFLQHRRYWQNRSEKLASRSLAAFKRAPIIVTHATPVEDICGVLRHIQAFKVAEHMKFEELQKYALERLYSTPTTDDDPVKVLQEVYNDGARDSGGPIHAELHKWARKFLASCDDSSSRSYVGYGRRHHCKGWSNFDKIRSMCRERFDELYQRSTALRDDWKLAQGEMRLGGAGSLLDYSYDDFVPNVASVPRKSLLPRPRSWSDCRALDWRMTSPGPSATSPISGRSWDDLSMAPEYSQPRLLEWSTTPRDSTLDDRLYSSSYLRNGQHHVDDLTYDYSRF